MDVRVSDKNLKHRISPLLFGQNLEHTRSCVYNGVSAQLLRNRKFYGKPQRSGVALEWKAVSGESNYFEMNDRDCYTKHFGTFNMKRRHENSAQVIHHLTGVKCGVIQDGITLEKGKTYELKAALKSPSGASVKLGINFGGISAPVDKQFEITGADWQICSFEFTCPADLNNAAAEIYSENPCIFSIGVVSLMPCGNFYGMRNDVVERLKDIGTTVIRWPGGNFAGEYRWKDGLADADERSPLESCMNLETQPHSYGYDDNEIGINQIVQLCREIGAELFLTVNLYWDSSEEICEFVEYCNGGADTHWGKIRSQHGFTEPFRVKYWSLGNEMGYGHMEGLNNELTYTEKALAAGRAMKEKDADIQLCACGPYPDEKWVKHSLKPLAEIIDFVSCHRYSRSDSINYSSEKAIVNMIDSFINSAYEGEKLLTDFRDQINSHTAGHDIKISFDEWNIWYAWYRSVSTGEGLFSGVMTHLNIKNSDALNMPLCCYFQPINEGAINAEASGAYLTPTGLIFEMMKPHSGAVFIDTGSFGDKDADVCASFDPNKRAITVTIINKKPYDVCVNVETDGFGKFGEAEITNLISGDILPGNNFVPETTRLKTEGNISVKLTKYSAARVILNLL
ncbi:hypothetical protein FACS1894105_10900 [Clostridia bacterium]|nr:hypothetical protein FACS1894105_10900 [Clostridia bacterium]